MSKGTRIGLQFRWSAVLCLHKYCCFDPLFLQGCYRHLDSTALLFSAEKCTALSLLPYFCSTSYDFFWWQFATVSIRRLLYIQNPADRKTWLPEGMKPWISKAPSTTSKGRLSLKPSHFLWIMPAWLLASHGNTDHANIHVCARPVLWKYSKFLRLLNLIWAHPKTTPSASCLGRNEPEHWLICSLVKIVLKRWL